MARQKAQPLIWEARMLINLLVESKRHGVLLAGPRHEAAGCSEYSTGLTHV
jgi:hypothetical protein